ncbi:folate family ECF transporter S component [Eubacteriales bacterium KG127]
MRKSTTTQLVTIAVFIAIEIILTRFLSIQTPIVRLGFGFLPIAMIGILYGPIWAGVSYAVGDVLGMMLWPTGGYFFGFTLSAFLTGIIFGLLLKRDETGRLQLSRILIACAIVVLFVNLGLDTLWLSILQGKAYMAILPVRMLKSVITYVLQVTLIPLVYHGVVKNIPALRVSKKTA